MHDQQIPYYKGVEWPMMMMAILASVMQCVGLIMPFFELAKRSGRVIGIGWSHYYLAFLLKLTIEDFTFLTIDFAGAFFSLMAIGKP